MCYLTTLSKLSEENYWNDTDITNLKSYATGQGTSSQCESLFMQGEFYPIGGHRNTPLRTAGKRSTELSDNISYINPIFKFKEHPYT